MTRLIGVTSACVLAGAIAISAQTGTGQNRTPPRGGGAGSTKPLQQGANTQNEDLKQARADMQRDVAEGKRLQEQLKQDRKSADKAAIQRDNDALKKNRDAVKKDQDRIKQLSNGRGRGNA